MNSKHRSSKGQSLVELAAVIMVCLPVLLCCIDASYIVLGGYINDIVCRDATRAAASGKPEMVNPVPHSLNAAQNAYQRAVAVIKEHNPSNMPIKVSEKPVVLEEVQDMPPGNMGGAVEGKVTVTTTVLVIPPFLVQRMVPSGVTLIAKHTVPITYTVRQTPVMPL
ncbi:MAG: hypothetical protein K2W95_29020 [Candidatus Obscuribacterales bacterium]|nr:hypothetical protein [Candidatus Obscuribacterales bacterium]